MVGISQKSIFVPPKSDNFFEGMRQGIGYRFVTALADIVDNSLTAGAYNIDIVTEPDSMSITIIDNGIGMNEQELLNAMTVASANPTTARDEKDLGRYGLGLKLASLSQCDSLSVFSYKKSQVNGYKWDLNHLRNNNWELLVLDPENAPYSELLKESGTIVIWEDIKIRQSSKNTTSKAVFVYDFRETYGCFRFSISSLNLSPALWSSESAAQMSLPDPSTSCSAPSGNWREAAAIYSANRLSSAESVLAPARRAASAAISPSP